MTDTESQFENEPRRTDRIIRFKNAEELKAEAELAENPPDLRWRLVHGIWQGREILPDDDEPKPVKKRSPRPECKCDIYGSPKRRPGEHHDVGCGRREPW